MHVIRTSVIILSLPPLPITDADCEIMPFKRLAQAILLQALQDLKALSNKPEVETARAEAIAFFERKRGWAKSFDEVCEMAGYDPEYIHSAYMRFMRNSIVDYKQVHEQRRLTPRKRRKKETKPRRSIYMQRAFIPPSPPECRI